MPPKDICKSIVEKYYYNSTTKMCEKTECPVCPLGKFISVEMCENCCNPQGFCPVCKFEKIKLLIRNNIINQFKQWIPFYAYQWDYRLISMETLVSKVIKRQPHVHLDFTINLTIVRATVLLVIDHHLHNSIEISIKCYLIN